MPENLTNENIELTLPVNAAYVSAARLTASSIANRMGFSIDDIEDIKSAVSEACIFIINSRAKNTSFKINFFLKSEVLEIKLITSKKLDEIANPHEGDLGIVMIKALMDRLDVEEAEIEGSVNTVISMQKKL